MLRVHLQPPIHNKSPLDKLPCHIQSLRFEATTAEATIFFLPSVHVLMVTHELNVQKTSMVGYIGMTNAISHDFADDFSLHDQINEAACGIASRKSCGIALLRWDRGTLPDSLGTFVLGIGPLDTDTRPGYQQQQTHINKVVRLSTAQLLTVIYQKQKSALRRIKQEQEVHIKQ
ncbi:hypothetical protein C5167_031883 [Papaver somniferum]|uniref:Uncharacterized protein n=1 Tax=Papaver somniferum TaxID=3469 RepID=A0A4Y7K9P1_PAPSO|nr:hypothetical protein C5167_031883 [Papaver somniferum]